MDTKYNIEIKKKNKPLVVIDEYTLEENKITFLFGESGIGKSLISKALMGLIDSEDLTVKINNQKYDDYLKQQKSIELLKNGFFVFQEPSSHLHPLLTLESQLNEGLLAEKELDIEELKRLWQGKSAEELKRFLKVYPKPYRPSGGEKQRVLCLMALKKMDIVQKAGMGDKGLFVFDEPTGNLDNFYRNIFISLLIEKYIESPFTITFITHDYSIISFIQKKYPHLLKDIRFKELYRKQNKVAEKEFIPSEYINWVKSIKVRIPDGERYDKSILLKFKKDFSVFGKQFTICDDNNRERETDLIVEAGDIVYLKAPSGVGKTTFAKIIMGLVKAEKYNFWLNGIEITEKKSANIWRNKLWGKVISMVFQHADEALNQKSKVKEVFDGIKLNHHAEVKDVLLDLFDPEIITDFFLNKKIDSLSGGQKQKLNLLRGFVLDAKLLILDEPVNGMDFESIKKVINLIEKKRRLGLGIILISHNEEIFDSFVDENKKYYLKEKGKNNF